MPDIRKAVINEAIYAIKCGILEKKDSISLFEIADTRTYVELEKSQWVKTLEHALSYYIEFEVYDKCIECRDLIKKISNEK